MIIIKYIDLLKEAERKGLKVYENIEITDGLKGLHYNNNIALSKDLETTTEKKCVLAEEIAHTEINSGNILDPKCIKKRKEEIKGRRKGIEKLVTLSCIISAYKYGGITNEYELAERLDITEELLDSVLKHYKLKHGNPAFVGRYIIKFEPLKIGEWHKIEYDD